MNEGYVKADEVKIEVTIDGLNGVKGDDGYTPIKGKDYWTEEDKVEIVVEVTPVIESVVSDKIAPYGNRLDDVEVDVDNLEIRVNSIDNDLTEVDDRVGVVEGKVQGVKEDVERLERTKADESELNTKADRADLLEKADKSYVDSQVGSVNTILTGSINEVARNLNTMGTDLSNAIAKKQDKLVAGSNITIEGNVISATGGGGSGDVTKEYLEAHYYDKESVDSKVEDKATVAYVDDEIKDTVKKLTEGYKEEGNVFFGITIDSNTGEISQNSNVNTSDFFRVDGGLNITFYNISGRSVDYRLIQYDADKNFITGMRGTSTKVTYETTTDANTHYVRVTFKATDLSPKVKVVGAIDDLYEANFGEHHDGLNDKQNTLIAGENITIVDNVISATGGGTGDVTKAYVDAENAKQDAETASIKADLSQKIESKDLKTINGNSIVGSGDIEIKGGESIDYDINIKNVNHRGWYEAPENTLPAYQLSKRNGFKYVECDVALTSDKIPVLLHDLTIDRTSNGSGAISEMTFSEVRGYDFGSWKNTKYVGTLIPSFDEFILMCKNLGISPYVELKANGAYSTDDIECVVEIVKKHGMLSNVTWISMSKVYLGYVKNILTDARLGYVVGAITDAKINDAIALRTESNDVFIDAQLSDVTDVMVDMCVNNNIPLEVWTVDSVDDVKRMNSYISGVTSNKLISGKVLCDYEISKDYTHQLPSFSFFTIRKTSSYVAGTTGVDSQTLPDDANATYTTSNINDITGDLVIKISDLVENYSDGKKFGEINIYAYDANGDYVGYLNPATYYSTGKTFSNSGFPSEITLKEEWFSKSSAGFSSIMRDSVIHLPHGFKVKVCMRRSNGTYITDNYEFSNFIMTHQNFIYIDT